jgi:hypothetical protein
MAGGLEKAIHFAFVELFGDDQSPADHQPVRRDPLRMRAIAAAPDMDDDAVDLLERHMVLQDEIDEFGARIGDLMEKHAGDERFKGRCRDALAARADLVDLQQRELLRAYYPPLKLICLPN